MRRSKGRNRPRGRSKSNCEIVSVEKLREEGKVQIHYMLNYCKYTFKTADHRYIHISINKIYSPRWMTNIHGQSNMFNFRGRGSSNSITFHGKFIYKAFSTSRNC